MNLSSEYGEATIRGPIAEQWNVTFFPTGAIVGRSSWFASLEEAEARAADLLSGKVA